MDSWLTQLPVSYQPSAQHWIAAVTFQVIFAFLRFGQCCLNGCAIYNLHLKTVPNHFRCSVLQSSRGIWTMNFHKHMHMHELPVAWAVTGSLILYCTVKEMNVGAQSSASLGQMHHPLFQCSRDWMLVCFATVWKKTGQCVCVIQPL